MSTFHSIYCGYSIYRQSPSGGLTGCRLPWFAMVDDYRLRSLSADTLSGIKHAIRHELAIQLKEGHRWVG